MGRIYEDNKYSYIHHTLFRGLTKGDKPEWVIGILFPGTDYSLIHKLYDANFYSASSKDPFDLAVGNFEVSTETVGVWTEFCDDFDTPIFEGDIIGLSPWSRKGVSSEDDKIVSRFVVKWHRKHFGFALFDETDCAIYDFGVLLFRKCKVIGNIHQKPELLTD